MSAPPQLIALARKHAAALSLDPALVCAVIEQESAWNPFAMRYEPHFFSKYVAPLYTNNKVSANSALTPRSSPRFAIPSKASPSAAKFCAAKFDSMAGDTTRSLLAWNGGRLRHASPRPSPAFTCSLGTCPEQ